MYRCAVLVALLSAAPLLAAEPASSGAALLDKFKALAGEWVAVNDDAHGHGVAKGSVVSQIRVTAGGSAVVETLFPGTAMEMVSIYHLDGKDLVMTHYCMAKNQPRYKAKAGDKDNVVLFEFAGGCNIDPTKDFFMHSGRVTFIDKDRMRGEWTAQQAGKKGEEIKLELSRKK
jgi:hypothetical protein